MPFGLPGRIVQAILNGPEGRASASFTIAGVNPVDGTLEIPERAFQFWPESISEEPEIGWSFKEIPGASHALAQWTQNGGRNISFEVVFSRFMLPVDQLSSVEKLLSMGMNTPDAEMPLDNRPMNISVREQVQYLRQYYLPNYVANGAVTTVVPPPIAMLCAPNLGWGEDGSDVLWTVMTNCSVTHNLAFACGEPRLATVSLAFRQIVQWPAQGVILKSRKQYADVANFETGVATDGGRGKNDLAKKVSVGP
jgi:hypothetical protein